MKSHIVLCLLFALFLREGSVCAQTPSKYANTWYFGGQAGMKFDGQNPPVALTDGKMSTLEGCSTISDKDGNLLFYTNGVFVWNSQHDTMINGDSLWGHFSSAQSALIVPKPGSNTIYYIFTY